MLIVSGAWAQDSAGKSDRSSGNKNPLNNVYFGEQERTITAGEIGWLTDSWESNHL
jgi:hypothetical protein